MNTFLEEKLELYYLASHRENMQLIFRFWLPNVAILWP